MLDENNELDDLTLYALGLKSKEEMKSTMQSAFNQSPVTITSPTWTYEEICKMEFRTILSADSYTLDSSTGLYTDMKET